VAIIGYEKEETVRERVREILIKEFKITAPEVDEYLKDLTVKGYDHVGRSS